jgi:hypothetical protein
VIRSEFKAFSPVAGRGKTIGSVPEGELTDRKPAAANAIAYSSTAIMKQVLNIKADNYLPALQRKGVVQEYTVGKMSEKCWMLTPEGAAEAENILPKEVYRTRGDRLNVSIATHDLLAQIAVLRVFLVGGLDTMSVIQNLHSEHTMKRTLNRAHPTFCTCAQLPTTWAEQRTPAARSRSRTA